MPCMSSILYVGILLVSTIFLARGSVANLQVFSFCCFLILPFGFTLSYFGSTTNSYVKIILSISLHTFQHFLFLLDFLISTSVFLHSYPIVQDMEDNGFQDWVCGGDARYLIFRNSSVLPTLILHQFFCFSISFLLL